MGNDFAISYMVSQLGAQIPTLLVYLVAFVLALVHLGRAPLPAILTLIGVAILIAVLVGLIGVQAYLINHREAGQDFATIMFAVGLGGNVLRAVGMSLLIAAIFVGRPAKAVDDEE